MESILTQLNPVRTLSAIPLGPILILSYRLCLALPSGLLPSGFPAKIFYVFLISPIRAICPTYLILLYLIIQKNLVKSANCEVPHYVIFSSLPLLHFSEVEYSPQHFVLKYPQSKFVSQCKRPSFTLIHDENKLPVKLPSVERLKTVL
jgi:hypothetical protein